VAKNSKRTDILRPRSAPAEAEDGPSADASSKASHVLSRLRADILGARLQPSQKLSFRMLAAQYGASITPLREALFLLAGDGLVVLESQRGFRVAPVSLHEFLDISSVRSHVETHALRLAIRLGDAAWLARVERAYTQFRQVMQKVGDPRPITVDWEAPHRNFHFALIEACGSPTLLRLCASIYDRFDRYRRLAVPTQSYMAGTADDHNEIVKAIVARDARAATDLLTRHISDITSVIAANLAEETNALLAHVPMKLTRHSTSPGGRGRIAKRSG
jgi:GntR family carbon starvation induced transcriptional regulator